MYMYPIGIPVYAIPPEEYYRMAAHQASKGNRYTATEVQFMNMMRMLWEQHIAWTRMTIISIAENLADEALVTQRLLRNPSDMAAVFRHFYGDQVATKFEQLLREHIVIAAELVKAAQAGDTAKAADAEKRWYANANSIASFLHSINPYWPADAMRKMLQ